MHGGEREIKKRNGDVLGWIWGHHWCWWPLCLHQFYTAKLMLVPTHNPPKNAQHCFGPIMAFEEVHGLLCTHVRSKGTLDHVFLFSSLKRQIPTDSQWCNCYEDPLKSSHISYTHKLYTHKYTCSRLIIMTSILHLVVVDEVTHVPIVL